MNDDHCFKHHMNSASADATARADLESLKRTFAMSHPSVSEERENKEVQVSAPAEDVVKIEPTIEKKIETPIIEKTIEPKVDHVKAYHDALELCLSHATFACQDVKNYTRLLLERHRKWMKENGQFPLEITCTFCNLQHRTAGQQPPPPPPPPPSRPVSGAKVGARWNAMNYQSPLTTSFSLFSRP